MIFGIFNSARNGAKKDILQMVELNRSAPKEHKIMAGMTLNQISSIFSAKFGGLDGFLRCPTAEQYTYIDALSNMERDISMLDPPEHRVGVFAVVAFRMWLCMKIENDAELVGLIEPVLNDISKAADGF